ncbi:MAG: GNAT family N-acetyltransferase [Vicinamibacterales bacterium]
MPLPPIDLALASRLERAEGAANARFVEARARASPGHAATWRDIDGTWAMFDGVGSPLTQTFGLGLDRDVTDETLAALERFYRDRGSPVDHEVSPLARGEPLARLAGRGYHPIELTDVLVRPLTAAAPTPVPSVDTDAMLPRSAAPDADARVATALDVAVIGPSDGNVWADAAADGWRDTPDVVPFVRALGAVYPVTRNATCVAAVIDGTMVATGVLSLHDGVALLAGASTRPEWRRRGAQTALLAARLRLARSAGCDLAMICARPGSDSHRNAERRGFSVAYTRIKWHRPAESRPGRP